MSEHQPETKCECQNNQSLLPEVHVHVPNSPDRQQDQDEVGDRVEDSASVEQRRSVDTMPRDRRVPDLGPWYTLPYLGQVGCDVEQNEQSNEAFADYVKHAPRVRREGTSVKQQNRKLRDANRDTVMNGCNVEPLDFVSVNEATCYDIG